MISDLFALCPNAKTATEVDKQEIETLIKHHDRTVFSGVSSRELDSCHSTAWRWKSKSFLNNPKSEDSLTLEPSFLVHDAY